MCIRDSDYTVATIFRLTEAVEAVENELLGRNSVSGGPIYEAVDVLSLIHI